MNNLDAIRDEIRDWSESLYHEQDGLGGYRSGPGRCVNLLSTTDVAWLRYATHDLDDLDDARRAAWVRWIRGRQDANDGHFEYTAAVGEGNMHSHGHAFWHANRALGILGSEIAVFPSYLRPAMTVDGLAAWFAAWRAQARRTHHDILGLVPILANTANRAWVELFYEELAGQQDSDTGTWPKGPETNISRTFACTCIFRATGRMPPQPEKIINAMLSLQCADGFWRERNHSSFSTMDAIYILVRLPQVIGYRTNEATQALAKIEKSLTAMYAAEKKTLMGNTHSMLAVVHALGLLREAFPGHFSAARPWRFDWDKPELFACELLKGQTG